MIFEAKATAGGAHLLKVEEFDNRIVDFCFQDFERKSCGKGHARQASQHLAIEDGMRAREAHLVFVHAGTLEDEVTAAGQANPSRATCWSATKP